MTILTFLGASPSSALAPKGKIALDQTLATSVSTKATDLFFLRVKRFRWQGIPKKEHFPLTKLREETSTLFSQIDYLTEREATEQLGLQKFLTYIENVENSPLRYVSKVNNEQPEPSYRPESFLPPAKEELRGERRLKYWTLLDDPDSGKYPREINVIHINLFRQFLKEQEYEEVAWIYYNLKIRSKSQEERLRLEESLLHYLMECIFSM